MQAVQTGNIIAAEQGPAARQACQLVMAQVNAQNVYDGEPGEPTGPVLRQTSMRWASG
jgi:hypothetical protein